MAKRVAVVILTAVLLASATSAEAKKQTKAKAAEERLRKSCAECTKIAANFERELAARSGDIEFAGSSKGWSKDNEKFLGRYNMNEAVFVEALENTCTKDHACAATLEEVEETLEEWFSLQNSDDAPDVGLQQWLCVDAMEYCCAPGHYGKTCKPCPGGATKPCSGHGDCKGDGQRFDNGACQCRDNFTGPTCSECAAGHYFVPFAPQENGDVDATNTAEGTCVACSTACALNCTGPGPDQCDACASGFELSDGTCTDIDECLSNPCTTSNTYCSNVPGSYECLACHAGCLGGCQGPDAVDCLGCQSGYVALESGGCRDVDECAENTANCAAGEYCSNTPGAYSCLACDPACDADQGCSGPTAAACRGCTTGYKLEGDAGCVDVDECAEFSCGAAETCTNSAGTFTCTCEAPSFRNDEGACTLPSWLAFSDAVALPDAASQSDSTAQPAELAEGETTGEDAPVVAAVPVTVDPAWLQGTATVGSSTAAVRGVNITFSDAMSEPLANVVNYDVVRIETVDECCGDKFVFRGGNRSPKGMTVAVQRTDVQQGWGQELRIKYYLAPDYTQQKDEL